MKERKHRNQRKKTVDTYPDNKKNSQNFFDIHLVPIEKFWG